MVPSFLRPKRPDLRIAFFHHTAFPPADVFNIIPWSREIITSLLLCDYVGFHIPRYVENFVDVARTRMGAEVVGRVSCAPRFRTYGCAMGVDDMCHGLRYAGREVGLGAHPVGIDVSRIEATLKRPEVSEQVQTIREEFKDRKCILSVERLDYVKGPIEKLQAFQALLQDHPELHEKVVLVSICTPAAPGMEVYQRTRRQVDELVGQINGRFSTVSWTPIRYFYRSLPFEDVVAYYAAADVAWITPLRDGLNLVAKEFIAAQNAVSRNGVLVLSEFAGAAVELHGAVLTNPYDPQDMKETLFKALHLDELDRQLRRERLASIVAENDVSSWGEGFLAAARGR
jgi:glucosylglycerol-phosphate synthase